MLSSFVIHHHKAGKAHFDLRILRARDLRCWSLLKEPPCRTGEQRLAIEREGLPRELATSPSIYEEAFGEGKVYAWDTGKVDIEEASAKRIVLVFKGKKMSGRYELRRMTWYPGNRWLLKKTGASNPIPLEGPAPDAP